VVAVRFAELVDDCVVGVGVRVAVAARRRRVAHLVDAVLQVRDRKHGGGLVGGVRLGGRARGRARARLGQVEVVDADHRQTSQSAWVVCSANKILNRVGRAMMDLLVNVRVALGALVVIRRRVTRARVQRGVFWHQVCDGSVGSSTAAGHFRLVRDALTYGGRLRSRREVGRRPGPVVDLTQPL
jgi:hypothetical protein